MSETAEGIIRFVRRIDCMYVKDINVLIDILELLQTEKLDINTAIKISEYVRDDINRYQDEEEKRRLRND